MASKKSKKTASKKTIRQVCVSYRALWLVLTGLFLVLIVGFLVWYPMLGKKGVAGQAISVDSITGFTCPDQGSLVQEVILAEKEGVALLPGMLPINTRLCVNGQKSVCDVTSVGSRKKVENVNLLCEKELRQEGGKVIEVYSWVACDPDWTTDHSKAKIDSFNNWVAEGFSPGKKGICGHVYLGDQVTNVAIPIIINGWTVCGEGSYYSRSFADYKGVSHKWYQCYDDKIFNDVFCQNEVVGSMFALPSSLESQGAPAPVGGLCTGDSKTMYCDASKVGLVKNVDNKFDALCTSRKTDKGKWYAWVECNVNSIQESSTPFHSLGSVYPAPPIVEGGVDSSFYMCDKTVSDTGPDQGNGFFGWETWYICPAEKKLLGSDGVGVNVGIERQGKVCTDEGWQVKGQEKETKCNDGKDNDNDGKIDCADSDCEKKSGQQGQICEPNGEVTCTGGLDNDGDGKIDCLDEDCDGRISFAKDDIVLQLCAQSQAWSCDASNKGMIKSVGNGKYDVLCELGYGEYAWWECNADDFGEGSYALPSSIPVFDNHYICTKFVDESGPQQEGYKGYESWAVCPKNLKKGEGIDWLTTVEGYMCGVQGWESGITSFDFESLTSGIFTGTNDYIVYFLDSSKVGEGTFTGKSAKFLKPTMGIVSVSKNRLLFPSGLDDFGVSVWIKPEKYQATIISAPRKIGNAQGGNRELEVRLEKASNMIVKVKGNQLSFNPGKDLKGGWHHIAVVRKEGAVTVYVDGVTVGSKNIYEKIGEIAELDLGAFGKVDGGGTVSYDDTLAFTGEMDNLKLYFMAPTDKDITDDYKKGLKKQTGEECTQDSDCDSSLFCFGWQDSIDGTGMCTQVVEPVGDRTGPIQIQGTRGTETITTGSRTEIIGSRGTGITSSATTETSCTDKTDNDNDGLVDCVDSDCTGKTGASGFICCQDNSVCTDSAQCDTDSYYGSFQCLGCLEGEWSCSGGKKCDLSVSLISNIKGGKCVLSTSSYSCAGADPLNAYVCTGDDSGLTSAITKKLVAACTDSLKCEYTCKSGYTLQKGLCVVVLLGDIDSNGCLSLVEYNTFKKNYKGDVGGAKSKVTLVEYNTYKKNFKGNVNNVKCSLG